MFYVSEVLVKYVSLVTWLVCLPLDPKVAGFNPAKAMDF
jgi:hypothetical protein